MVVNGENVSLDSLPEIRSLTQLVKHYQLHPQTVVVELNGHIPQRNEWDSITLKEQDRIELIRFVGGG